MGCQEPQGERRGDEKERAEEGQGSKRGHQVLALCSVFFGSSLQSSGVPDTQKTRQGFLSPDLFLQHLCDLLVLRIKGETAGGGHL